MTRKEAIELRPQSARAYGVMLGLTVTLALMFLCFIFFFGHFTRFRSTGLWPIMTTSFLVLCAFAAQAWERLFAPVRAAERTSRFSERQRDLLRRISATCWLAGALIAMTAWVAMAMTESHHTLFRNLSSLGWLIWMAAFFLTDILGYRSLVRLLNPVDHHPLFEHSSTPPLQSDHWGNH